MYFNENWSAEICPLNRGNPLNRGPLNRGFTVLRNVACFMTDLLTFRRKHLQCSWYSGSVEGHFISAKKQLPGKNGPW